MMDGGYDAATRAGPAVVLVLGAYLVARTSGATRRGGGERFAGSAAAPIGLRAVFFSVRATAIVSAAVGHVFHTAGPWLEPPGWSPSATVPVGMTIGHVGLVLLAAAGPASPRSDGVGVVRGGLLPVASMLVVAGVFVSVPSPLMLVGGASVAGAWWMSPGKRPQVGRRPSRKDQR